LPLLLLLLYAPPLLLVMLLVIIIVPFIDKLLEALLSPWLKVIESTIPVVALR